jgi:hypothetical protein
MRSVVSFVPLDVIAASGRAARVAWMATGLVGCTYLEVLVGCLLVLLGHGGRSATGEEAGGTEDNTSSTDSDHDVHEDLHVLSRRCLSTGTVRTESDPVGWRSKSVSKPL